MAEIIRIDENTWRFEDGGVRFFLLEGEKKALLIDTGKTAPGALELAASLTSLPIILANTHADPDHTSGNASFDSFYMSASEEENYRFHGGSGVLIPVSEGDVIDLGGRTLEVIDIPGHTPGSIALLDISKRTLYAGDSVQDGNIYMFGTRRDTAAYLDSMRHLRSYTDRFDTVYPCHGSFPVSPELIPQLCGAAEEILKGSVSGEKTELFGLSVLLVRFPFAGFYTDIT